MNAKKLTVTGLTVFFILGAAIPATARFVPQRPFAVLSEHRIPHILIVKFADHARPGYPRGLSGDAVTGLPSVDRLNSSFRLRAFSRLFPSARVPAPGSPRKDLTGYCVLEFPLTVDIEAAYQAYSEDPNIEHVEYDYFATIMRVPDDPYFSTMWALNQAQDHDINAPEAWDISPGDSSIVLADTDTGVLYTHPDLIDNIWINPGEDLDGDGVVWDMDDMDDIDNDGNGYVDDLIGYDFVSYGIDVWPGEDGSGKDNNPKDFHGHGTHTSGTIAATTNNATGVAGVAGGFGPGVEPGCRIMCLRMGYSFNDDGRENGRTHMSFVAEAFNYATNNGASAINYSFGSSSGGGIEAATNDAVAAGLVIAASAGNDGTSNPAYFGYLQKRSDVLCVASTNSQDRKSGFSNWGAYVDISAPGSSIRSTVSYHYTPTYAYYSGTSMSAPHVVGLVGLLKSVNPSLTRQQVFDNILLNADDIDDLNPSYAGGLGAGRINAYNCLSNAAVADFSAAPRVGDAPLTVEFTDESPDEPTAWLWRFGDGDSSLVQNPTHVYEAGLYGVSLTITTSVSNGYTREDNYIMALDEEVSIPTFSALRGSTVYIEINLENNVPVNEMYLPIFASNVTADAYFDSLVATGCRTEYFERRQIVFSDKFRGKICLRLRADNGGGSPPLDPGSGAIARAYFKIRAEATPGNMIELSTMPMSSYDLEFSNDAGTFTPNFSPGGIIVDGLIGDFNQDNAVNPLDVVGLVNYVYYSSLPPPWPGAADTNCDGEINPLDVVFLVNYVYFDLPFPCE